MRTASITAEASKKHSGRKFFIILATLLLVMASAGIAGQALAGDVQVVPVASTAGGSGQVNVAADQALGVAGGSVTGANAGRVIVNDDGTAFKAPAQVCTGDRFTVDLALLNKSHKPLELQITISSPDGFSLEVSGKDGTAGVVRIDTNTWAFRLDANETE